MNVAVALRRGLSSGQGAGSEWGTPFSAAPETPGAGPFVRDRKEHVGGRYVFVRALCSHVHRSLFPSLLNLEENFLRPSHSEKRS
ncbi:unnamed protein product [Arctogadus glacialis]